MPLAAELLGLIFPPACAACAALLEVEATFCPLCTLATEPVIQGKWLQPGSHLDLIGSFTPGMREADDGSFVGASLYVDTEDALRKSGELLGPMSRGVFDAADVRGTLAELCRGTVAGRTTPDDRTVFKAVGTALEDLAAAILVYERHEDGVGRA